MAAILKFKMAVILTKMVPPLKRSSINSSTIMPIFMLLYQGEEYFVNILYYISAVDSSPVIVIILKTECIYTHYHKNIQEKQYLNQIFS